MSKANQQEASMSAILLEQTDRLLGEQVTKEIISAAEEGKWPDALWQAVEESGLTIAMVPEDAGGVGVEAADALRLVRRSAFHALPLPLPETLLAQSLWVSAGGEVVEGAVTLAPCNPGDRIGITGSGGGFTLSGAARRVPWGGRVGHVLVLATDANGNEHLALVPQGKARADARRNLAFESRDTLVFDGVSLPAAAVRAAPAATAGEGLLLLGAQLRTQQMVGAMERCLDYAIAYANERVQFGRPIGKFQAVQHMLAVAAGHFAAATAAADAAIEAHGRDDAELAVAVAKSRAGEAAGQVAAISHQVFAAMGFTQEHPLHFSTRRLWSWRDEFGAEAFWQERIGRLVCNNGGDALWPLLTGA
ncbi:MAG: acyl-CoA dehydrogenase [Betaproteobacteria bacterium]|nr:acyl-CoA dehydrogenase [Betaproteobacteria bacterium]